MSTKISQDELRKFMKQKRENLKLQKIDSPFAKYSSAGQLSCSICNVVIKTNNLWVSHIVGKVHKQNLMKGKKGTSENTSTSETAISLKRPVEQPDVVKKVKTDVFKVPHEPQAVKPVVLASTSLLAGYSSSDDDSDEEDIGQSNSRISVSDNTVNSLPPEFFDNPQTNGASESSQILPEKKVSPSVTSNNVETLPEGFFDNPILDAKARNIEYKDPVEEEYERFKKSIAEETNVSKTIIEVDLEESTLERDISQIDEHIQQWNKKRELELLAENVKFKMSVKEGDGIESESTDEDLDENDLLDWRSKSIKKT